MAQRLGGKAESAWRIRGLREPRLGRALAVFDLDFLGGLFDGFATIDAPGEIDELAHLARVEALSFRIQMLGGNPRLAHCLTTVGAMGGWQGGIEGSGGQGR